MVEARDKFSTAAWNTLWPRSSKSALKAMSEKGGAAAAVSALTAKAKLAGMWRDRRYLHDLAALTLGRVLINRGPDVRFQGITGHRKAALNRSKMDPERKSRTSLWANKHLGLMRTDGR
jgi:hypothetical protein